MALTPVFHTITYPNITLSTSCSQELPGLHDARPVFSAFIPAHLQCLKKKNTHSFLKAPQQREMLLLLNLVLVWK